MVGMNQEEWDRFVRMLQEIAEAFRQAEQGRQRLDQLLALYAERADEVRQAFEIVDQISDFWKQFQDQFPPPLAGSEMRDSNAFVTTSGDTKGDVYGWPDTGQLFGTLAEGEIAKLQGEGEPEQITEVFQGWPVRTSWDYVAKPFEVWRATGSDFGQEGRRLVRRCKVDLHTNW